MNVLGMRGHTSALFHNANFAVAILTPFCSLLCEDEGVIQRKAVPHTISKHMTCDLRIRRALVIRNDRLGVHSYLLHYASTGEKVAL